MKTKVLIIEDNIITLDEIEYRVNQMGYDVETAVTGDEAIRKIKLFTPDIILSDINLGEGIDGIETVKRINEYKNIPVIYLTAYDDNKTLARAQATEPYSYIIKPVQERELQIAISIALYKSKTEQQLRELNGIKNKLFSIIAHDLIGSYSTISGLLNLLLRKYDNLSEEDKLKYLHMTQSASDQGLNLINNLIQWSRAQLNGIIVQKQKTQLDLFIKGQIEKLSDNAKQKNLNIFNNIDKDLTVSTDQNILDIVVRNLLLNAIKFTENGGAITLESNKVKGTDSVILSIADTGVGMSQEKVKNLFKIDINNSTPGTNREPGNGLGLIICKELIEKQGNKISVKSQEGSGSTFSITLLLAENK